jgi:hypothetical protein
MHSSAAALDDGLRVSRSRRDLVRVRQLAIGLTRDVGLVACEVERPRSRSSVDDACPTVSFEAVAFMHSLATYHASVNDNTLVALLATVLHLGQKGLITDRRHSEAPALVWKLTSTPLRLEDIARRPRAAG